MFAAYLLLLAAPAQEAPPQPEPESNTIVVTGKSLADTERDLQACLARGCPPDEDIAATLAHAENQFVSGDYKAARRTLLASSGRNRGQAKAYPVAVSDLTRASGRIALHLGEADAYRISTFAALSALEKGLPADDPRVLVAEIEVGDGYARLGKPDMAERSYRRVARRARALGQGAVEGFALLRVGLLNSQLAEADHALYGAKAIKAFDRLIASPVPGHRRFATVSRVLKARLAARTGGEAAFEQLIAELQAAPPTTSPALLYSRPIDLDGIRYKGGRTAAAPDGTPIESFDGQWIDVAFWVAPDGTPTDVEVLRRSPTAASHWIEPVLASVRSRRYAPLRADPTDPGLLRVERYTYTAHRTRNTPSRISVRDANPRIEMLDLSRDAAPSPTS